MKNWIWLVIDVILLLTISFHSEAVSVRNKRNTAPDGVVLDSVNVLPGTRVLLSKEGKTVSITCKQSSSTATGVEFQLQVNSGAGGTWTPIPTASSTVWVFELEAGKQYKCVAINSAGTKESEIYKSDVISIKINENPCKLHEFQSLACTCEATSKIGNPNIKVKWYADGFTEGSTEIVKIYDQGVNTPVKDGVINRNQMRFNLMMHATLIQCKLSRYNGLILPRPLQNQIFYETKMDVTYFPDEIQTRGTFTGQPDIRTEGEVVEYICRTEGGRPDPTVIYQQKRIGSEQWQPIPDPQPRKVLLRGNLKGFDTTYKFKANFKLHNGTSFRCAVKENLTFPEPRQFNPIIVHYFAAPVYKKSSENETNAAYIVTVNSNPLTQQVTCDPPAVVQKLSNSQWNITIPIVNSTTTDYRGQCLADGINERVINVAGYHHAGPTDEPVPDEWNGGIVFGAVIGILILLTLIILFILCLCGCLRCRKPNDQMCRCGNFPSFRKKPVANDTVDPAQVPLRPVANEPGGSTDDNEDASSDELCHCFCLLFRSEPCSCNCFASQKGSLKEKTDTVSERSRTGRGEPSMPGSILAENEPKPDELDVATIQKCLKETYKRMIDVENYKEVWWSEEFINFNKIFTKEHAKIRPRKQRREEQSVILPNDFEKLFTYDEQDAKRVCLVGEPGMGKTTQIVNQVLSWERSPFLKKFRMLFYIPLNALPADNACIYTYIYKNILSREIGEGLSIDDFKRFVLENEKKSIFLLDGFDELKNDKAKEDIVQVTYELPEAHIVITTRESGGTDIVNDQKFIIASICGFKQEEVIDIMKRKFPQCDANKLFENLKNAAPLLFKSIYYNPFILHMFCFLYMNEEEITIPPKLTDIYIDLTCFLISKRKGIELSKECFFDDIENSEALKEICQVAYKTLIARHKSFSGNRLKLDESKMTALTCKEVSPRRKSDSSVQLQFIHKSVQEFLAAVHSVVQFTNSNEIPWKTPWNKCTFEQLPDELEKYGELYPRFVAGLLHRHKRNPGLGELFKTLMDKHSLILEHDFWRMERRSVLFDIEMMLIPDYERFIKLQSESFWLSDQFSIYLDETDCPDDAINEIVDYMGKMLIIDRYSMFKKMNILAKILEHKQCPIEVVYFRYMSNELKPGGEYADEYRVLETAIAGNTSLQGMIIYTLESIDKNNLYFTLCQESNSINWCMCVNLNDFGNVCYKKLDSEWIETSHVIESEDAVELTSRDSSTQNKEEILFIRTAATAKLLGNIQRSYPFLKHLYLWVTPDKDENIYGELTNLMAGLKSLHLLNNSTFEKYFSDEESKSAEIKGIALVLNEVMTDQSTEVSSMKELKRFTCRGQDFEKSHILDQLPRLTVLAVDLRSKDDVDALVRYLSSDAVNQLREVSIYSFLKKTEEYIAILRTLKNVSSLRRLKFHYHKVRFDPKDNIDIFVELIKDLPHLSYLFISCRQGSDLTVVKDCITSNVNNLNERIRAFSYWH
ncbi:uncharacterized protein LOC141906642 isoform X2 [Tubulanus polymorphus]